MKSICFLGRDGGFTKGVATLDLLAPGTNTARIQEAQTLLFHVLCEAVEIRSYPSERRKNEESRKLLQLVPSGPLGNGNKD